MWPEPSDQQRQQIEITAQKILDERSQLLGISFAEMYGSALDTVFTGLSAAHKENDRAVMEAYGFPQDMAESEIVAELMKRYQEKLVTENG
ncbi:MAG: type IIL restriction-modification enzyme MmeI [Oxalobacter sp.]